MHLPSATTLADRPISAQFLAEVPIAYARRMQVVGLASADPADGDSKMDLAIPSVEAWETLDILRRRLGRQINPVLAPAPEILRAIDRGYQQQGDRAGQVIQRLDLSQAGDVEAIAAREDLLASDNRSPVVALVNSLLLEAVKAQASDVHIQPEEDHVAVRMRLDGVLFDAHKLPVGVKDELASRIKVMGGMDIAEKRRPQDGRATVEVGDRLVDLRLSSVPTSHGERIVFRLLDKSARLYTLPELGMESDLLVKFRQLLQCDHGLILVTGPTGAGKSTTLYGALQEIHDRTGNIITLEDPIEYQLDGISQIQVSEKKGMTFAGGLRSVLRQDPDIIMVGEIRDKETAVLAMQASMTGHLVFSTLHTNDAPSAIARLLDLGVEPYVVASTLKGVMAQRLVRQNCPQCAQPATQDQAQAAVDSLLTDEEHAPTQEELASTICKQGQGCPHCRNTGYKGRVGLFELLVSDDQLRAEILLREPAAIIKASARKRGMRTLREDGIVRVLSGKTTAEEVLRATME